MQEPTLLAKKHSLQVSNYIKQKILNSDGSITFADFMQAALYAPKLGYYNSNCEKFGPQGDFITAPMLGELFGASLANQCLSILQNITNGNILELGAGNGQLACQLIKFLGDKFDQYFILEPSAELQLRQKKLLLNNNFLANKIVWLNNLPKNFNGIIIANEVLDAIPVHLFKIQNNQILERKVALHNNNFCFKDLPASKHLADKILKLPILKNITNTKNSKQNLLPFNTTYSSEICLLIPGLIKALAKCLKPGGTILLFDYGFLEDTYYHADRNMGTLMCHYQHHVHDDPFFYPGLQDLTSHVNFSLVIKEAAKYKLTTLEFCSLANFLMNNNLQQEFTLRAQTADQRQLIKLNQEINTLISPAEMGELFKFLMLAKL